jgi:hypothetical protein
MSATWDTYHRRSAALQDVVATIEANPGNDLPWPDIAAETFSGPDDLLVALHDKWTRRLEGRIELFLETDDSDLETSVANAWHAVATELPGVRALLDRYVDHPALRHHEIAEHRLVAIAAGRATTVDPMRASAWAGSQFVRQLRADGPPAQRKPQRLVTRLKEAFAV